MFQDLDATLKALLDDPAAPPPLKAAEISFDTPDKDYTPNLATVNLFLNEVTENRTLRDEARVMDRTPTGYVSRMPSLRVDCTYLVTAWSQQSAGLKAAEEHTLLGLALLWFGRFPVVGQRFLRGSLMSPPQPYPLSTVVARTQEGRSNGEFWSALGIAPRPAFSVTVTISMDPYDVAEELPAVQRIEVRGTSIDDPVLTGRVLDHALAPVTAAEITVVETGAQATSAANGEFAVSGLDFGAYILRVRAGAAPVQEVAISYAADHQAHTVVLSEH